MARILALGVATLDIINTVEQYPAEDDKTRATSHNITRGGNAANTLVVLSQLGHQCSFAGVLANSPDTDIIRKDFNKYQIDTSNCPVSDEGSTPASYITLSKKNGSRTIIHYRDLRELCYDDFIKINLCDFDWLHFEGREIQETKKMLSHIKKTYPQIPVSLEIEKPRKNIEQLFKFADVLFFAQSYALSSGCNNADDFITQVTGAFKNKDRICTWGDKDTVVLSKEEQIFHCQCFPPVRVIDTIAAGDTFNAGFIDARLRSLPIDQALESANKLAGQKCGQLGLEGLGLRKPGLEEPGLNTLNLAKPGTTA